MGGPIGYCCVVTRAELIDDGRTTAHLPTLRLTRGPDTTTVSVTGEIDASNAARLVELIGGQLPDLARLIVDCSGVTFFAVEGYSVLQRINVMCAQAGTTWVLVPSIAVSRVLRVCNPGGGLVPAGSPRTSVTALRVPHARPLRLIKYN